MLNWFISRKTTDACVSVQHTKQEVCNPWFNSNWKTTLWLCHHHIIIFAFQFLPTNYPLLLWHPLISLMPKFPNLNLQEQCPHSLLGHREPSPVGRIQTHLQKSLGDECSSYHSKHLKNSSNSFSRCQDNDGDVLYVWTTLNLRAEHGFGNLYNQTYVLGDYHDYRDRWKGHVWTWW